MQAATSKNENENDSDISSEIWVKNENEIYIKMLI